MFYKMIYNNVNCLTMYFLTQTSDTQLLKNEQQNMRYHPGIYLLQPLCSVVLSRDMGTSHQQESKHTKHLQYIITDLKTLKTKHPYHKTCA